MPARHAICPGIRNDVAFLECRGRIIPAAGHVNASNSGQHRSMSKLQADAAILSELGRLVSEERNPRTMDIDLMPTGAMLRMINAEDRLVPEAVEKVIPEIARAVDLAVVRQVGYAEHRDGQLVERADAIIGLVARHILDRRHGQRRLGLGRGCHFGLVIGA